MKFLFVYKNERTIELKINNKTQNKCEIINALLLLSCGHFCCKLSWLVKKWLYGDFVCVKPEYGKMALHVINETLQLIINSSRS